jgi:hypothetical protein
MATEYYYFVTGLPSLNLEDTKLLLTPLMFLHSAQEHMTKEDYDLLKLLLVPNDINNLANLIYGRDEWADENTIDKDEWQALLANLKDISDPAALKKKHIDDNVLPLVIEYLHRHLNSDTDKPEHIFLTEIYTLFYDWVVKNHTGFIREWFSFDCDMRNVIIALNCRKHNLPVQDQIIGSSPLAEKLKKSTASDFGLGNDFPYLDILSRLNEQTDILEKEKGYDVLRWKWLDDRTFFDYFTLPRLMAYFIRLQIVYRWIHLSQAVGEKRFGQVLHDLETSFSFPEEFALNKR